MPNNVYIMTFKIENGLNLFDNFFCGFPNEQHVCVQGSRVQVKGIPDVARHASVKITDCTDADNFDYPPGLICAAEKG